MTFMQNLTDSVRSRLLTQKQKKNPSKAISRFSTAKQPGNAHAIYKRAVSLHFGEQGVKRDLGEAMILYRQAIGQGHVSAMYTLGSLLHYGEEGVEPDLNEAMSLYRKAIKHGHVGAMSNMGALLHYGGQTVIQDLREAMSLYRKAAEHGQVSAMVNLAALLHNGGEGVHQDLTEAMSLYRRAAEHGHAGAMVNLGLLLNYGADGVERNLKEAILLYRKAIKHGDTDAMFNLGVLLENGDEGFDQNVVEAVSLYRRAAEKGHVGAMNNLGDLLKDGVDGVERDVPMAMALFSLGVTYGNTHAMSNLAWLLLNGSDSVKQNIPEALALYERAVDLGNSFAIERMGWCIEYGTSDSRAKRHGSCLTINKDAAGDEAVRMWNAFEWGYEGGEREMEVVTRFERPIANCLIGLLIAHIFRNRDTREDGRNELAIAARKFGQDALLVRLQDGSRVLVRFKGTKHELSWKCLGSNPVRVARNFLRSIEGTGYNWNTFSGFTSTCHTHLVLLDCSSSQRGCGALQSIQIELSLDWLLQNRTASLPVENLWCGSCLRPWDRLDVYKHLWPTNEKHKDTARKSLVSKHGSSHTRFDVFISHAGPDKLAVAKPIYEALARHNVSAFLDCEHLKILDTTAGEEMERAMQQARIGVFILSPQFAAREWTMRELRCFLNRDEICKREGQARPVLLPIFHRLDLLECSHCDSKLYSENSRHQDMMRAEKFFEAHRQKLCSTKDAIDAMKALRRHSGVERRRIGGGEDLSTAEIVNEAVARILRYIDTTRYDDMQ